MKTLLLMAVIWLGLMESLAASGEVFDCQINDIHHLGPDGSIDIMTPNFGYKFIVEADSGRIHARGFVSTRLASEVIVTAGVGANSYTSIAKDTDSQMRTQMIKIEAWRDGKLKPFVVLGDMIYSGLCEARN